MMKMKEQVNIVTGIVDSVEQAYKRSFGTANLKVVHNEKDTRFHKCSFLFRLRKNDNNTLSYFFNRFKGAVTYTLSG